MIGVYFSLFAVHDKHFSSPEETSPHIFIQFFPCKTRANDKSESEEHRATALTIA